MGFQPQEHLSSFTYGIAGIATVLIILERLSRGHNLNAIPTVGSSNWLSSLWAGAMYSTNAVRVIQEGCDKYNFAPFKIADRYRWIVVFSKREHVEELLRASDDEFSSTEAVRDRFNTHYTLPRDVEENPYHVSVVRSQLTRNIGTLYPVIRDEIVSAFDEVLDLSDAEWKSMPVLSTMQKIICRTSNRLFVGLPLCRDPDWIDLNIRFTLDFVKTGIVLGLFPRFLRPLAARIFTGLAQGRQRGLKHLGPVIEERLKRLQEDGERVEMPNDLLSWLIEEAKGYHLTGESLSTRVLLMNFVAIHTSSNGITHALLHLALNPQYVEPLREEVERIVAKEGWTKVALAKMHKIDSFLRECQRLEGFGVLSLARKAMKDCTLSDGTFIPKGTTVSVAVRSLHHDGTVYEHPNDFEPFRFATMHEEEGKMCRMVSTGLEYLAFGHGKHACPGRFFAANELKSMLAHVVMTYDIRLESDAPCPLRVFVGFANMPNPRARVLFRKRVD